MNRTPIQWMLAPLGRYAEFSGRSPRAEYWWFVLFYLVLVIVTLTIDVMFLGFETIAYFGAGPVTGLLALAIFLPSLGVTVRRLHDIGRSGWWLLAGLIPLIGGLLMLYWYCQRGTIGDNRFGPDPYGGVDGRPPLPVN